MPPPRRGATPSICRVRNLIAVFLLLCWIAWCAFLHFGLANRRAPVSQPTAVLESPPHPPPQASSAHPPPLSPPPCPPGCHALQRTELPGDVVKWGVGHTQPSAAACCAACEAQAKHGCNTWVWCGSRRECPDTYLDCWLKKRAAPWEDVDVLQGRSTKWTSGVLVAPPTAEASTADPERACDFALLMADGLVRMRLRPQAASAVRYVTALLRELGAAAADGDAQAPAVDAAHPPHDGLRFYRAEPVPERWGSLDWPDNYFGGRWGPPYALLQGSLRPQGTRVKPASPDLGQVARPVIRRGMLAWAAGGGGPDFFIALAQHPEWGNGHTVFAEAFPEDMGVIDTLMRRPLRVSNWGSINATELVTPMPFRLLGPEAALAHVRKHRKN